MGFGANSVNAFVRGAGGVQAGIAGFMALVCENAEKLKAKTTRVARNFIILGSLYKIDA